MREVGISQVDAIFSGGIYPIEFLFYYSKRFETKWLRRSLRQLSSDFWPVFGEYADGKIYFERYLEDDFYDEQALNIEFRIPESEAERLEVYRSFLQPDLERLFFLKVIHFSNGTVLIPKLNHLAGDGYSYFYFLSVLANLSKKNPIPLRSHLTRALARPHHRRTVLKDFSFCGLEPEQPQQKEDFVIEFSEIPREEVRSIIKDISTSKALKVSRNDVLCAIAVKKLIGLGQGSFGGTVSLTIPIDVRRRIKGYGERFFGNGLMLHTVNLRREHVENSEIGEVATGIRESMPAITKQVYLDYLSSLEQSIAEREKTDLRPFDPDNGCLVTNISRLPVARLDFGTGVPELLFPLTIEKNSAAIMADKQKFILRFAY